VTVITVDTREPYKNVGEHLLNMGVDFEIKKLDHGADYVVENDEKTLGVQRKTVTDYVSSIGRLKHTLYDLRTHHEYSALLIEGDWRLAHETIALRRGSGLTQTLSVASWHNFLFSQQLRGTMLLRTTCLKETCLVLKETMRYLSGTISPPHPGTAEPSAVLLVLPGVGEVLADEIVGTYGDVYTALGELDEWDEFVDGIGPTTKRNIQKWLQDGANKA